MQRVWVVEGETSLSLFAGRLCTHRNSMHGEGPGTLGADTVALYDQCMGERVIHETHCVPQAVHTHVNHHIIHLTSAILLSSLGGESLSAQAGQVLIESSSFCCLSSMPAHTDIPATEVSMAILIKFLNVDRCGPSDGQTMVREKGLFVVCCQG